MTDIDTQTEPSVTPAVEALRGPWRAVLSQASDVLPDGDLGALDASDEVDISIRRGSALPDDEGCRTDGFEVLGEAASDG